MISEAIRLGLKTFAVAIALLAALAIAAIGGRQVLAQFGLGPDRSISVVGSAALRVQPDKVQVSGAVTNSAKSASDALDENNAVMARILQGLNDDGIGRDKISTTGFSIAPQHPPLADNGYSVNELVTTGYVVKNSINVTLPANEYSGKLLDRMIRLGATNIDSVSFTVDDPSKYDLQAREVAAADAIRRAEAAAKALGLRLGKVISVDRIEVDEYGARRVPVMAYAREAAPPSIEIMAREQIFAANLAIVFELEE